MTVVVTYCYMTYINITTHISNNTHVVVVVVVLFWKSTTAIALQSCVKCNSSNSTSLLTWDTRHCMMSAMTADCWSVQCLLINHNMMLIKNILLKSLHNNTMHHNSTVLDLHIQHMDDAILMIK